MYLYSNKYLIIYFINSYLIREFNMILISVFSYYYSIIPRPLYFYLNLGSFTLLYSSVIINEIL